MKLTSSNAWSRPRSSVSLALAVLLVTSACAEETVPGTSAGPEPGPGPGPDPAPVPSCAEDGHDHGTGACPTTLGQWQAAPSLTESRDHHLTFVVETPIGAFLYAAGGAVHAAAPRTTIERATIAADGTPGPWETLPMSHEIVGGGVVVHGQRALFTGGYRGASTSSKTDRVTVHDDGSLSLEPGPELTLSRFHHGTVRSGAWVYVTGGFSAEDLSVASVERLLFDEEGSSAWVEDRPFPEPRSHHAIVEHGGALYAVAGFNRQATDTEPFWKDTNYADVIRAEVGSDGTLGEWTKAGELDLPLAIHAAFVFGGHLYVVGGIQGPTKGGLFVPTVRRAAFLDDGNLAAFEDLSASLPIPRGHCHHAPLLGNTVYSVGGARVDSGHVRSEKEAFFAAFH